MLRRTSACVAGISLILGIAACSSAPTENVDSNDEALSVGGILTNPIRLFPEACGSEPVATTPVTYTPGWTPWGGNGEDVSLVELAQHDGIHDIVAIQLSRTDGAAHHVIGRAYVHEQDLPCFVGRYGRWYGLAHDVNLLELFMKGATLAHAMTETGGVPDPKACVSRVIYTPEPSPSGTWSFPTTCVASGLVTVGIYDAIAGYKTKLPCTCGTDLPPWRRQIEHPRFPLP